jgi:hypothetical protein
MTSFGVLMTADTVLIKMAFFFDPMLAEAASVVSWR